ncbi:MAG: hypothetical protein ACRDP7_04965, partial [Trebonia sp.]
ITVALLSWLQATRPGCGQRRAARRERWARAGAVIAVFASTYSVPISQQRHRTLGSFWFFMLSNPYVLAAIAIAVVIALVPGTALRRTIRLTARGHQVSSPALRCCAAAAAEHRNCAADRSAHQDHEGGCAAALPACQPGKHERNVLR